MSVANKGFNLKKKGFLPTQDPHLIKSFFFKIFITNGKDIKGFKSWDLGQGDRLKFTLLLP